MTISASGEPQTTNAERVSWGMASLAGLIAVTGGSQGIDLTPGVDPRGAGHVLIDVLANLRHYADAAGLDFDAFDRQADEFSSSEVDDTIQPMSLDVAAYRHYLAQFPDTTRGCCTWRVAPGSRWRG